MRVLSRGWKRNDSIYSSGNEVEWDEENIVFTINNPKLKDSKLKSYATIRKSKEKIDGEILSNEGNTYKISFNKQSLFKEVGEIWDFYCEYNGRRCRVEAGLLEQNETRIVEGENTYLEIYKTINDNLSIKIIGIVEKEIEEADEYESSCNEDTIAQLITVFSFEDGFEANGFIESKEEERYKPSYLIMRNREVEYTEKVDLIWQEEDKFSFTIRVDEYREILNKSGIWEFYMPWGERRLKVKSTYDGIENKQKVIDIPQIIYKHQGNTLAYKMYYTLKNEIALLIREYITISKIDKAKVYEGGIEFSGEFYVESPLQVLPEKIDGLLKTSYFNKYKNEYKCLINTNGTNNKYHTKFSVTTNKSLDKEEIKLIKKSMLYNLTQIEFEVEGYKVKTSLKIEGKHMNTEKSSDYEVLSGKSLEKAKERYKKLNKTLAIDDKLMIFQSFHGKSYSCSPKGIQEYIRKNHKEYKTVWVLENEEVDIPRNVEIVRPNSKKYFYYMAKAKYFINNGNFPDFYEKRKGTVHLQTWHGTPLKTLGRDIKKGTPSYGENNSPELLKRNSRWDFLIGPNEYTSKILKRAFDFKGVMLNTGYPRNDILHSSSKEKISEAIKEKLGIPKGKKVILYAPTWRDSNFHGATKNKGYNLKFSTEEFSKRFGEDYVLLLRLHYREATRLSIKDGDESILNMSFYDDIQELYLISDLLITDYSSVMFDYGNLKRNIIFYCYDYKEYSSSMRGWYVSLPKIAPGPIVFDERQLFSAIENIEEVGKVYKDKLEKFNEDYCKWEDGQASKRVFEAIIK